MGELYVKPIEFYVETHAYPYMFSCVWADYSRFSMITHKMCEDFATMRRWCDEQWGRHASDIYSSHGLIFQFRNKEEAMLFKLRWL